MLDTSKAYECVNHVSLYNKHKMRNKCPTILTLLMCTYKKQSVIGIAMVKFSFCNGVKQGGVLSDIPFYYLFKRHYG